MNYDRYDKYLEPLMAAVRRVERFLGPEDDWVEDDRRILFQAAQRHLGRLHTFVYNMGTADYVTTVHASPDAVERVLMGEGGYQRNLVSARKYRDHHEGGKQWAVGSFSKRIPEGEHGYKRQHHIFIFEAPDGGTDVYAHSETSVVEGKEHLTESNQIHADPLDMYDLYESVGMEYGQRESLK